MVYGVMIVLRCIVTAICPLAACGGRYLTWSGTLDCYLFICSLWQVPYLVTAGAKVLHYSLV